MIKKSTDISALASNPIFTNNTLIFELPSNHTLTGQVIVISPLLSSLSISSPKLSINKPKKYSVNAPSISPLLGCNPLKHTTFPFVNNSNSQGPKTAIKSLLVLSLLLRKIYLFLQNRPIRRHTCLPRITLN